MQDFRSRKPVLGATDSPARPGDFPIGSPQSRAAARTKLENWGGEVAPNLSLVFYESDGSRVDANHAIIDGGNKPVLRVDRCASESLEEFHLRVEKIMADSRGRGRPRGALFERIETPSTPA
jgi:hypothetical protein